MRSAAASDFGLGLNPPEPIPRNSSSADFSEGSRSLFSSTVIVLIMKKMKRKFTNMITGRIVGILIASATIPSGTSNVAPTIYEPKVNAILNAIRPPNIRIMG